MCSNWLYLKRQQTLWLSIFNEHFTIVLREPSGPYPQLLGSWAQEQGPVSEKGPYTGQSCSSGRSSLPKRAASSNLQKERGMVDKALVVNWEPLILVLDLPLTDTWSVNLRSLICKRWMISTLQVVIIREGVFKERGNVSEHRRPSRNSS